MNDNFVAIAKVSDIPDGEARVFKVEDDISVAVCNLGETFHAIENICSHDDGPLGEGILIGTEIKCPRHKARFNVLTGKATHMPAVAGIQKFPVKVENDTIFISIDE